MTVTAEGVISLPLARLRDLLAASRTFQAWTCTSAHAAAKGHVYLTSCKQGLEGPLALIDWPPFALTQARQKVKHGVPFSSTEGSLVMLLRAPYGADESSTVEFEADELLRFGNQVAAVMRDVELASGMPDTLRILSWQLQEIGMAPDEERKHAPKVCEAVILITFARSV